MNFGSFKELYDVVLKSTLPIEIGKRKIAPGEVIAAFDTIQLSNFQEIKDLRAARGGYGNKPHIFWETTKEVQLLFTDGVFSKEQFALMLNSKLIDVEDNTKSILINFKEEKESDENGSIKLKHIPFKDLFVYEKQTGNKIEDIQIEGTTIVIPTPYTDVIVRYVFEYLQQGSIVTLGKRLFPGYISLEGKTRVKEDENGQSYTGIIYIPRIKLMSDLSMNLGSSVGTPINCVIKGIAVPIGERGNSHVMELAALSTDIDVDEV